MKKGFLFTMDAVLALILVIVLAVALAAQQNALPEKGDISSSLRQQAEDQAITGFYLNQLGESHNFSGKEYGECVTVYELLLDPKANDLRSRETLTPKVFCEDA